MPEVPDLGEIRDLWSERDRLRDENVRLQQEERRAKLLDVKLAGMQREQERMVKRAHEREERLKDLRDELARCEEKLRAREADLIHKQDEIDGLNLALRHYKGADERASAAEEALHNRGKYVQELESKLRARDKRIKELEAHEEHTKLFKELVDTTRRLT